MLPAETERVWNFCKQQPALAGFVLVGGSALALQIGHRLSEDLDMAWAELRLPRVRLDTLRRAAGALDFDFQLQDDEATIQEFTNAGLDLHDYHQNYLVNGKVRVSFFAPEPPLAKVLQSPPLPTVRVASLAELFNGSSIKN